MKRAKMQLNMETDMAIVDGKRVILRCTSSGHYCLPLGVGKIGFNLVKGNIHTGEKNFFKDPGFRHNLTYGFERDIVDDKKRLLAYLDDTFKK